MATLVAPSLERIVRDARILLNQPKPENSRFSDAELTGYANDAIQQIFLTVNEYGEGQFDKITGLDVTNAVETVTLPTDCFAIKAAFWKQGTINRRLVYRQNITEDYGNDSSTNGQANYEPYYYLRGNSIVLRPIPGFTSTNQPLIVEYTAYPQVLVYGADTLDAGISPLFKELVVSYVVMKAKMKDAVNGSAEAASGYQVITGHFADLFKAFKHQISERSKDPQFISTYEPY